MEKVIRCKPEIHVPTGAVCKELRHPTSPKRRQATDCESQEPEHWEIGREWFWKGCNFLKKAFLVNPSDSHNVLVEQPEVKPKEQTPDEMRVSSKDQSTDLPGFAERSKRPNTRKPTNRHNVFTHFQ